MKISFNGCGCVVAVVVMYVVLRGIEALIKEMCR